MIKFVYVGWKNDYEAFSIKRYATNTDNVFMNIPPNKRSHTLSKFLYKLHTTKKIEKVIRLPFQSVWNRFYLDKAMRNRLSKDDTICFIFSGMNYALEKVGFLQYLRDTYPKCRLLCIFGDKVALYQKNSADFCIEKITAMFDVVGTYNTCDVEQYGLVQMPVTPHDYSDVEEDESIPASDVVFVGRAKGRLEQLLHIYEQCTAHDLVCDFHIIDVPADEQKYPHHITYNQMMPYKELLKRVKRSRCVLNIVQDGADGVTLRDYEAIGMNKLLMTNSHAVCRIASYNEQMVIDIDRLDTEIEKLTNDKQDYSWNQHIAISFNDYFKALEDIVFDNTKD